MLLLWEIVAYPKVVSFALANDANDVGAFPWIMTSSVALVA